MASVQIATTTSPVPFAHAPSVCYAGTRLWMCYSDGSNLQLRFSEDNGVNWSSPITVKAGNYKGSILYDAVNGRLNVAYALGNSSTGALFFRAITSNVASGTPGSLTTELTIDAGGTDLGVNWPYMIHTPTASFPRYWIGAMKHTDATHAQTNVWYCAAGSAADTLGNWFSLPDILNRSDSDRSKNPVLQHWTVAGADKVTVIGTKAAPTANHDVVTITPDISTPSTTGVTRSVAAYSGSSPVDFYANGPTLAISGAADILLFGRLDHSDDKWDFYYSTDGVTFTALTSGTNIPSSRAALLKFGSDFYVICETAVWTTSDAVSAMEYRKITSPFTTLGSGTAFSDNNANPVQAPPTTALTDRIVAVYRSSTASPYSVRYDEVAIGGAPPPGPSGSGDLALLGAGA